jgi:hypothetical protein
LSFVEAVKELNMNIETFGMGENADNPGYLLLFRGKDWDQGLSDEELQEVIGRVMGWFDGVSKSGKVKGGQPLARSGKFVSGKNGRVVADGPFAESKEVIGGYLMLDVETLDEVLAIAKSYPCLQYDITIEVRPLLNECPAFTRARARLGLNAAVA